MLSVSSGGNSDKEVDFYLEWRKTPSRSLLVPPIKYNTTGCTMMNEDLWIFGGKGSSSEFNELWKYSTSKLEWECIEARGSDIPPPRDGHTLTKISKCKFIIYGGQGDLLDSGVCERGTENGKVKYISMRRLYDDMYEFDCQKLSWNSLPRKKIRPLARRGHSMIYIKPMADLKRTLHHPDDEILGSSGKGHLLLFGGSCIDLSTGFEKPANDVWLYCLEALTWEEIHCDGQLPLPVYGHCAELVDNNMIVIGGTILSLKSTRGLQKFPKKKRVEDLSQSLVSPGSSPQDPTPNNTIAVLNITTMTWSQLTIDISSTTSSGLNLIGHSIALSPVNSKEILIFGGRRSDENATANRTPITSKLSSFTPTATLWTLNLDHLTLSETPLKLPKDLSNLPEARMNQLFVRRQDDMVPLKPPPVGDDKSVATSQQQQQQQQQQGGTGAKKGKSSRRAPPLPVKRPKLQPHPVITLFGGSKLYSSGFCSGMLHEIFFVPIEKKESSWVTSASDQMEMAGSTAIGESDMNSLQDMDGYGSHRFSTMSVASAAGSAATRRMSSLQMMMANQSDEEEIFHMMNIKENSVTKLFSPKRGVGAHYFAVKTQLSRSRSTFSRPGTANLNALPDIRGSVNSPTRRPISAPSTLFHELNRNERDTDNNFNPQSSSTQSPSSESPTHTSRQDQMEKIKAFGDELCPLIKGLSVHEARQVFQRLHAVKSPSLAVSSSASSLEYFSSTSGPPLASSSSTPALNSSCNHDH